MMNLIDRHFAVLGGEQEKAASTLKLAAGRKREMRTNPCVMSALNQLPLSTNQRVLMETRVQNPPLLSGTDCAGPRIKGLEFATHHLSSVADSVL